MDVKNNDMGRLLETRPISQARNNEILSPLIQMELLFDNGPQLSEPVINDPAIDTLNHDQDLTEACIIISHTLPVELSYHGFRYSLVCRGVRSCVYQQTLGNEIIGYETFIIRIQPEVVLYGKKYPARERWPKDEDFSKTAFSFWTHYHAMLKFKELEG
jgi:hypothetical protein